MKKLAISPMAALIVLTACAAPNEQTASMVKREIPGHVKLWTDNKAAYRITCDDDSTMELCIQRAKQICLEKSFNVLEAKNDGFDAGPMWRTAHIMFVRCRTDDGLYPGDQSLPIE